MEQLEDIKKIPKNAQKVSNTRTEKKDVVNGSPKMQKLQRKIVKGGRWASKNTKIVKNNSCRRQADLQKYKKLLRTIVIVGKQTSKNTKIVKNNSYRRQADLQK